MANLAELNAEVLRQTTTALKDRRHLSKARVIDVAEVLALKEAEETRNAGEQSKA